MSTCKRACLLDAVVDGSCGVYSEESVWHCHVVVLGFLLVSEKHVGNPNLDKSRYLVLLHFNSFRAFEIFRNELNFSPEVVSHSHLMGVSVWTFEAQS